MKRVASASRHLIATTSPRYLGMRLLASRHGALGQPTKQVYVCLRCRVEQTQQKRAASTTDDRQRGATSQHTPEPSTRQALHEGGEGIEGAAETQDAPFTVTKYSTKCRLKKIRPAGKALSKGKNAADQGSDATTTSGKHKDSVEQPHMNRRNVDAKAFATHVYTRNGQELEDLRPGQKAWYEREFLKQAPTARVTSLQKFAYGRSGKMIEELTDQERNELTSQHRIWIARRKEKARNQSTREVAGEDGSSWKEGTHKGGSIRHDSSLTKPIWRAFVTEKGQGPQDGSLELGKAKADYHAAPESHSTYQERFLDAVSQQRAQHAELQTQRGLRPRVLAKSFFQPSPTPTSSVSSSTSAWSPQQVRAYHFSARSSQQALAEEPTKTPSQFQSELNESVGPETAITEKPGGIRAQLRQWQEVHGHEEDIMPDLPQADEPFDDLSPSNSLTRLPNEDDLNRLGHKAEQEEARDAFHGEVGKEGFEGHYKDHTRFLRPGDLIEMEYLDSEKESMMGIYIRRVVKGLGQFLMLSGKWVHVPDAAIPYSVAGWIDPKELEPLHKHLPNPQTASDLDQLRVQAYMEDMDVPRELTGPLIARLQAFSDEVNEIYRRNASALDDAHNKLAHETDLRYGSLASAATALLNIPANKLPLTALFTVRKALANGGFAFNIDRRSHRVTGYMQIRSKQQVRNVEQVREWVRQWQDDLASKASVDEDGQHTHKSPKGAQILYSFIEKSQKIIARQRENRQPSLESANVGPSKTRIPITADSDCVKVTIGTEFTAQETEIVKFLEAWCCSSMFVGLPRIESMPPLILNALGLYPTMTFGIQTGFLFLQELGVIMPHENRVRFDQHLLLPSSQHSKPLQNLMTSLMAMQKNHNLHDTMADHRHDWRDLPVYCIDSANAHEIDDGISIEDAGVDGQGKPLHWLHVHIANPTAFFSRSHPLAKMARHMGETLYMPERTYMMMPRWATQGHFSLAPNRPCLSFSTKLTSDGEVLEYKVRPGIIRNVMRMTYEEVEGIVAANDREQAQDIILTVGGLPPPQQASKSHFSRLQEHHHNDLRKMLHIARARQAIRERAGGLHFEQSGPEMTVWQNATRMGLAWDHPHRLGSRTVIGDPVIQLRTQRLENWFTAEKNYAQVMVSESMLLCSEIAAKFCDDRNIPAIYRGTVALDPDRGEHPKADQWRSLMAQGKQLPMYLGLPYLKSLGYTVLRTRPLKHAYLGMSHYTKATSPLRRYGDMILHWQIEAALKHEAETGQSMIISPDDKTPHDRSFLPFSAPVLETIMLGLQPRETMVMRAKRYSNDFWAAMLLFRMFHHKEGGPGPVPNNPSATPFAGALPPGEGGFPFETLTAFVPGQPELDRSPFVVATTLELNIGVEMTRPEQMPLEQTRGQVLEVARQGDVWEVKLSHVDMYRRRIVANPTRLIAREGM